MTLSYAEFIANKKPAHVFTGPDVAATDVHPMLHDWQIELVRWACKVGRAALWADTGLGKTVMQIEWARLVVPEGHVSLIVAPLAVCQQTIREAGKLGVDAAYVRHGDEITGPGLWVTNYEMVQHFDPAALGAVVLDEASILKQSDGKMRTKLIQQFAAVPFRLACTATPAPNDPEELTNQAEFLGHSSRVNMLAAYFIHDDAGWRMKGHARQPMMRWMSSWAVALRNPSDLGYPDTGYDLPGLDIVPSLIPVDIDVEGQLFATDLGGVGGRAKVRRETLPQRCARAVEIVNDSHGLAVLSDSASPRMSTTISSHANPAAVRSVESLSAMRRAVDSASTTATQQGASAESSVEHATWASENSGTTPVSSPPPSNISTATTLEPWIVWCGLNDEQTYLEKAFGDRCYSLTGSQSPEQKVEILYRWLDGHRPILLTKVSIAGMGINMQHCARMAFVGLSDSYEQYYQAIRRCYRYGQTRIVHAHVILSELESQIAVNIARKEREASGITAALVAEMRRARQTERATA